jgi:membrane-associated phospholipid phosphatase
MVRPVSACSSPLKEVAKGPRSPLAERLSAFFVWALPVGIAFFSIYPTTNWLASLGDRHYALFLEIELGLPFTPELVWLYLSMYVLFILPPFFLEPLELRQLGRELILATCIAGVIFVLLPAQLGFSRTVPVEEPYRSIFMNLFSLDRPFNLVPSLHVVYSYIIAMSVSARTVPKLQFMLALWLVLIVVSTVLVHQHHLLDVVSGLALASLIRFFGERK